ncbi:MAG: hypothetical protein AB7Q42_10730 [Acidimicrobiia bacterium]
MLSAGLPGAPLALPAAQATQLPGLLAERGVAGGAAYDGLIAITAAHHSATLLSLDRRAAHVYRRCGAEYELLTF